MNMQHADRYRAIGWTSGILALVCVIRLAVLAAPPLPLRILAAGAGGLAVWAFGRALRAAPAASTFGSAVFGQASDESELILLDEGAQLPSGAAFLGCAQDGRLVCLPRTLSVRHGCIVGGTGAGKSFSFFLPNSALARGVSCVFADPKSELWKRTSGLHPKAVRYAPDDPDHSAGFNWIPLCGDARMAELLARAFVESGNTQHTEQVWLDMETAFLAAIFAHASTLAEPTPLTAYRLFTGQGPEALLSQLTSSESSAAREQAIIFRQTSERMRGSIVPVVAARLRFLRDPRVARFTSATLEPPRLGEIRLHPQAIYWCLREQDIARLRPLTSAFFTLLFEQVAANAPDDAGTSVPVTAFLDEFATIGTLPHFETTISVARGRGMSLWLGLQSLAQLEARYGKPNAQTILTNCSTKIVLSGLDTDAAEYVSRTLGQATVVASRRAWHHPRWRLFGASVTDGPTEHPRPLLTGDEVRRLPADEMLVVTGNRPPLRLRKRVYDLAPCQAEAGCLGEARAITLPDNPGAITAMDELPPLPPELAGTVAAARSRKKRAPPRRLMVLERPDR